MRKVATSTNFRFDYKQYSQMHKNNVRGISQEYHNVITLKSFVQLIEYIIEANSQQRNTL